MVAKKNIFVLGLSPFHKKMLQTVRHAEDYEFHSLLDYHKVVNPAKYDFDAMLEEAEEQLKSFPGSVDAILHHWDFPSSTLQPILCERFGLRAAPLDAILKCEHKYWARVEQRNTLPDITPRFEAVDPFDDEALEKLQLPYPFWLKPIKAFSSHLGFRIDNEDDFRHAIKRTRRGIRRLGDAFNRALRHTELPDEIAPVNGNWCIAEEILEGLQCGIEGYLFEGKFAVHGVFDCVKDTRHWSFTRYEYPSVWPKKIQNRMAEIGEMIMRHIGYDNAAFGIEFFWHKDTGQLQVLEINARISQSHSDQCIKVEGVSNHEVLVDVALGREPEYGLKRGKYRSAAKFMLRKYHDAKVVKVPTKEEIKAVEHEFEDCIVKLTVNEGQQLSDLRNQDSYSFEIANIYLGARSQGELLEKYDAVAHRLPFEFSDGEPPEDLQFRPVRY